MIRLVKFLILVVIIIYFMSWLQHYSYVPIGCCCVVMIAVSVPLTVTHWCVYMTRCTTWLESASKQVLQRSSPILDHLQRCMQNGGRKAL